MDEGKRRHKASHKWPIYGSLVATLAWGVNIIYYGISYPENITPKMMVFSIFIPPKLNCYHFALCNNLSSSTHLF